MIKDVIISTIQGEEHLGVNLKEQCINYIDNLEHNWNELKQYCLDEQIPEEYGEYNSYIEFSNSAYQNILNKMEKLEDGGNDE